MRRRIPAIECRFATRSGVPQESPPRKLPSRNRAKPEIRAMDYSLPNLPPTLGILFRRYVAHQDISSAERSRNPNKTKAPNRSPKSSASASWPALWYGMTRPFLPCDRNLPPASRPAPRIRFSVGRVFPDLATTLFAGFWPSPSICLSLFTYSPTALRFNPYSLLSQYPQRCSDTLLNALRRRPGRVRAQSSAPFFNSPLNSADLRRALGSRMKQPAFR